MRVVLERVQVRMGRRNEARLNCQTRNFRSVVAKISVLACGSRFGSQPTTTGELKSMYYGGRIEYTMTAARPLSYGELFNAASMVLE